MAKETSKISFTNAIIHFEDGMIEELPKKKDENSQFHNLNDVLKKWNGIEGISFTITQDKEIVGMED